jgi:hypothetical protein
MNLELKTPLWKDKNAPESVYYFFLIPRERISFYSFLNNEKMKIFFVNDSKFFDR